MKYDTFLEGRENSDDDLSVVGSSFNSLLSELLSNLSLFNSEDRAYIENAKKRTYIPQIRRRLSRARDRANSRSRSVSRSILPSSTESSFASTSESSTVQIGDPAVEVAAAADKEKETARVWQLKLEIEAAQRNAKLVKIESQEKTAAVMQAAIDEGLAASLAEIVTIDEDDPQAVALSSTNSSFPPANSVGPFANSGTPPSTSVDELAKILGSQRLKSSIPKDNDRFAGGADSAAAYARFRSKFTSEVLEVNGVTDDERFIALQERTSGKAGKTVANFVYESDKSQALKKALEELDF